MPFLLEGWLRWAAFVVFLWWCFRDGGAFVVFFEVVVWLCFVAVWHHFSTPRLSFWQLWVSAWAPWRPMAWQFSGGCACGVVVFLVWLCFCGGVVVFLWWCFGYVCVALWVVFFVVLWWCFCTEVFIGAGVCALQDVSSAGRVPTPALGAMHGCRAVPASGRRSDIVSNVVPNSFCPSELAWLGGGWFFEDHPT